MNVFNKGKAECCMVIHYKKYNLIMLCSKTTCGIKRNYAPKIKIMNSALEIG